MRIINGDSVRDTLLKILNTARDDIDQNVQLRRLKMIPYIVGFIKGLTLALAVLEAEGTVASLIADNNINRLRIKEREHHV